MTGYTVHTGSTEKFASGWDRIFGDTPGKGAGKKKAARTSTGAARAGKRSPAKKKKAKKKKA